MEYVLIEFDPADLRTVLMTGNPIGDTGFTLMVPAGNYDITLSGDGYCPAVQNVTIAGTQQDNPLQIRFAKLAPAAGDA